MSPAARRTALVRLISVVATTAAACALPAATTSATADEIQPTVTSWGAGSVGQLGNGTVTDSSTPAAVTDLLRGDVKEISAGGTTSENGFALALATTGGTVRAWGHNASGQLGNSSHAAQKVPVKVPKLPPVTDIAAGGEHALALDAHGQVYSWGDNAYGQLGNNRTGDTRSTPARIQGLPNVKQIAAGCDFSLALLQNGAVYAWGRGVHGQLGNGKRETSPVPRRVNGLPKVAKIDAGCHHAIALTQVEKGQEEGAPAGTSVVKSWGYNVYGQLGNSSTASSATPVDVDFLEDVADIDAGGWHNYARLSNGQIWGWGHNQYGQLLDENEFYDGEFYRTNRTAPIEIPQLRGLVKIGAGAHHGVALKDDHIYTWGQNADGQLGNGTTTDSHVLVKVLDSDSSTTDVTASLGSNTTYVH
ncbi:MULTISPECIES: sialidase [unclassified Streptomyces]|uniref:RCC1 domain-containing protein n=1 Tax=unclassified Streptomyces TaxID=2593676 RepID=UPI0029668AD3|nr:sialidase [Streptomyces sp. SJL17-1]